MRNLLFNLLLFHDCYPIFDRPSQLEGWIDNSFILSYSGERNFLLNIKYNTKFYSINFLNKIHEFLLFAVENDYPTVVKYLTKYFVKNKIRLDFDGNYPLVIAVAKNNLRMVKYLLDPKNNPHSSYFNLIETATILPKFYDETYAQKNLEIFKYLFDRKLHSQLDNENFLILAAENGNLLVLKYLVEEKGINPHVQGQRALQLAKKNERKDVMKYLSKFYI